MSDWSIGCAVEEAAAVFAQASEPGALLLVRHNAASGEGEPALRRGFDLVQKHFPEVLAGRRSLWREVRFAVSGNKAVLTASARALLTELTDESAHRWQVVLIDIPADDAAASLRSDPGYALQGHQGSVVAWVTPISSHPSEPGPYPEVEFL